MIRIDGDFTLYVLQGRNTEKKSNKWFSPSYDTFGSPAGFTSSDDCWQKMGVHATFDDVQAFVALKAFAKAYPEYDWRMMSVSLSQHHTEIASILATVPGKAPDLGWPTSKDHRKRIDIVHGEAA